LYTFAENLGHDYNHLAENYREGDNEAPAYGLREIFVKQAGFAEEDSDGFEDDESADLASEEFTLSEESMSI